MEIFFYFYIIFFYLDVKEEKKLQKIKKDGQHENEYGILYITTSL